MALEEFEKKELSSRDKGYVQMRSIRDYGMGIVITGLGLFFLFSAKISKNFPQLDDVPTKIMGGIGVVYGIFRIYRGYQKKYLQ